MTKTAMTLASLTLMCTAAHAGDTHTVLQQDKEFSEEEITIKVGDKVSFENADDFFHNVFSLSAIKSFDLGSYPTGEAREVEFTEEGEVEVECAIHPSMYMTIKVEK